MYYHLLITNYKCQLQMRAIEKCMTVPLFGYRLTMRMACVLAGNSISYKHWNTLIESFAQSSSETQISHSLTWPGSHCV